MSFKFQKTQSPNCGKFVFDAGVNISIVSDEIALAEGVESVVIKGDSVTVNKSPEISWNSVEKAVSDYFSEALDEGASVEYEAGSDSVQSSSSHLFDSDDIVEKIKKLIDEFVNPVVGRDGGAIEFVEYKDGVVFVRMHGACSGCPGANMTLKGLVHSVLNSYLPEVSGVEAV